LGINYNYKNRLKAFIKITFCLFVLIAPVKNFAQHHSQMFVEANTETKSLNIKQILTFSNDSEDVLKSFILNDWNNSFSDINSPLAKRFSDEFYRGFHLANEEERGSTNNLTIIDPNNLFLTWERYKKNPDLIIVRLREKLAPHQKIVLQLSYTVKIPSDKFTKQGYDALGGFNLKNWFITPARYENYKFLKYSNVNLDDIANGITDFDIDIKTSKELVVTSDLDTVETVSNENNTIYKLTGKNRTNFNLFIEPKLTFYSYKNRTLEVLSNLKEKKVSSIQQAIIVDRIINYTANSIGEYPYKKIIVSQTDYDRNPFYGLNQLPSFISPFSDEFVFEIKFLKTYLNAFLKNSLQLDNRKDGWIFDGIQVYAMMKYIDEYHPNEKMLGSASTFKLLKSFNLTNLDFNEQYSYFYMLMARKNLDQALGDPKNSLIKFNEQIASKYRAGLSLKFLDDFLGNNSVTTSIRQFYEENKEKQAYSKDFESTLKSTTTKNINWFFNTVINTREIIDYKFAKVSKTNDSISFSIKNKTGVIVPVPVYGIKHGEIVFKKWIEPKSNDSIFKFERKNADKIVLNFKNEVPEYNLRNNSKSLKSFFPNNRPVKFVFMKDLEDPYYNQILYVPTLTYNFYDGLSPGLRLHNKTILDKPFTFDVNPAYSTRANTISGSASFAINQNYRNSTLYNVRYSLSTSYFHYAPDATYLKINPTIQLRIRESDFRDNHKQLILFRQIIVNREKSNIVINNTAENYSVFNAKYINNKTEVTNHFNLINDLQLSGKFGKLSTELAYRKLFENNRQINLRLYAGSFLYNTSNTDYYSFALDRPTDYLFDYNYYGRSEDSGFYSQQLIIAEGGFKSKLDKQFANHWISTFNASYTIWNFVEVYGDVGFLKNRTQNTQFVYDNGIKLNLVPDYFEVYFPVYSNNGWEISQNKYKEKVRFLFTLSPNVIINLFKRKWL
jgi:hypothetical protein